MKTRNAFAGKLMLLMSELLLVQTSIGAISYSDSSGVVVPDVNLISFNSGGIILVDGDETVDKDISASSDLTIKPVKPSQIVYGRGAYLQTDSDTVIAANAQLADYDIDYTIFTQTEYVQLTGTGRPFAVTDGAGTMTAWMEVVDGSLVKAVKIQLSQSGSDIVGRVISAKYIEDTTAYGQDFDILPGANPWGIATGGTKKGYGIDHLVLKRVTNDSLTLSRLVTVGTTLTVKDGVNVVASGANALTVADTYATPLSIDGEFVVQGRDALTLTGALSGSGGTIAAEPDPQASAASETVSGGVVTTAWQTLVENAQLSDMTNIVAVLGGKNMGGNKNANTFFLVNNGNSASCQFQYCDIGASTPYTKCVSCELRQNGNKVEISSANMYYKLYEVGDELGYAFTTEGKNTPDSNRYQIDSYVASFNHNLGGNSLVKLSSSENSMIGGTIRVGGPGETLALLNIENAGAVPAAGGIVVISNGEYRLNVEGSGWGKGVGPGTSPIVVERGGAIRTSKLHPFVPGTAKTPGTSQKITLDGGLLDVGWYNTQRVDQDVFLNDLELLNGARVFGPSQVRVGYYADAVWHVTGNEPSRFETGLLVAGSNDHKNWTVDVADVTQCAAVDFTLSGPMSLLDESYPEPEVVKTGAGTMLITGKCKSQTEGKYLPFVIRAGVLKLGVTDAMCGSQNITLDGGSLVLEKGTSDSVGVLKVSSNSSLVVPAGSSVAFADSSAVSWGENAVLNVNSDGETGAIRFGTDRNGLSAQQLSHIRLNGRRAVVDETGFLSVGGFIIILR